MAATQTNQSTKLRSLLSLLGFAITFLLGDQFLARLRLPYVYGTRNQCRSAWDQFEQSPGAFDVIYLGCSYEWYGISPRDVDAEIARLGGGTIRSFNLSSSAASMVTNYLVARRIVESGRLPRLLYLDISPIASDVTQHNWLRHGLRAMGEFRDLPVAASVGTDVALETLLNAAFRSYYRWDDAGIAVGRIVLAAPVNPALKMRFDDRGWAEWTGGARALRRPDSSPTELETTDQHNSGQALDVNAVALRRGVELLTAAGVEVRLLEMPLATIARPDERHENNSSYLEWKRKATAGLSVAVVTAPKGVVTDSDFYDPGHLNAEGARKFSRWLARDVASALAESDGRMFPVRLAQTSNDRSP